jgi:hypothetical protein
MSGLSAKQLPRGKAVLENLNLLRLRLFKLEIKKKCGIALWSSYLEQKIMGSIPRRGGTCLEFMHAVVMHWQCDTEENK